MPGILGSNFNDFIMVILDKLLAKFGTDKVLHHLGGGLICAVFTFIAILQDGVFDWSAVAYPTIGAAVVFIASVVKEYGFDDKTDWWDIAWAMAGCLWVFLSVAIGVLFNQLSV